MRESQKNFKSPPKRFQPQGLSFLYEDHDILVVDKRSGLLTVSNEKVIDQKVLADIAKNDKDLTVSEDAIKNITDRIILADITENDEYDYYVREAAKERLFNI